MKFGSLGHLFSYCLEVKRAQLKAGSMSVSVSYLLTKALNFFYLLLVLNIMVTNRLDACVYFNCITREDIQDVTDQKAHRSD